MLTLPDLFIQKRKHFGLAIGRTSLRGIELNNSGKVKLLVEMQLSPDVFDFGVLVKKEIFIASLKKLIQAGKFTTPYVAVCFSEAYAYSREYSVPVISLEDVYEAVSYHVKDIFPFPEDELYFDWKLLETTAKEHKITVVAVQKKILDPLVAALKSVNLKPLSFEPGAGAIARLLLLKSHQHTIVTEVNRRGAYVTLVEGEKSLFTTIVNYTPEDTSEIYLNNIIQTIMEITRFYQNKGIIADEQIQVVLTGEIINQELARKIFERTKFVTKILVTPVNNPAFNKAYAAAISSIAPPQDPNTINLLPADIQKYYDRERSLLFYKSLFLRSSLIVFGMLLLVVLVFLGMSFMRQDLDRRVKTLTRSITNQEGKSQNLLLINAQAQNIVSLAPLRKTPKDKLQIISSIIPEKIIITQWDYDDSKLMFSLNGIASSREELLVFKDKLEETEEFTKITLPLGSLELPENIKFTITFILKK